MKIEVLDFRSIDKGSLKGFAIVRMGDITIHGVSVIQVAGKDAFVGLPQKEMPPLSAGGKKRYFPIVELNGDLKAAVYEAVLTYWRGLSAPEPGQAEWQAPPPQAAPQGRPFEDDDSLIPF